MGNGERRTMINQTIGSNESIKLINPIGLLLNTGLLVNYLAC